MNFWARGVTAKLPDDMLPQEMMAARQLLQRRIPGAELAWAPPFGAGIGHPKVFSYPQLLCGDRCPLFSNPGGKDLSPGTFYIHVPAQSPEQAQGSSCATPSPHRISRVSWN